MDLVLHIYWISDGLHRVGGDDVVLHLGLPRQGGGSEHVLQCGQHHDLLRLAIGIIDVSMSQYLYVLNKHVEFMKTTMNAF